MQFSQLDRSQLVQNAPRRAAIQSVAIILLVVSSLSAGLFVAMFQVGRSQSTANDIRPTEPEQPAKIFPVTIRKPAGPPRVFTGLKNVHGHSITIACSTCHATREANFDNKTAEDLDEFHGSLEFAHGNISCLSCHNSEDYDALKLADGSRVEFTDVMTLCAQCHGPQMTDYEHGAHGGFNGYWDLTRGPREKNNCVDCHNPHSPKFPSMQPTFKPKDRFLEKGEDHGH